MYVFVKPFRCNTPTSTMPFTCPTCQFTTAKKGNFDRHLLTKKHKEKERQCRCGKNFESRAGLWKHTQQCLLPLLESQHEMIQSLLQKHDQVQDQVKELNEKMSPSIHISIFLNEKCKEAMNWGDFIQQLDLSENKTIIDTIQQQLQQLGYKRPVHVLPTQVLYIKQQNQWKHDAPSIQNAITVLNEHIHQTHHKSLQSWEKEHPTWYLSEQETDMYTKISDVQAIDESMLMVLVPKHKV